ncbi:unnamed protein product [Somion occarium]|uniref:Uncharacterized protein n=1 Tax=Somion occarium TaxID=3059160 RepID=A0ABP1D5J6_9APHY
MCCRRHVCYIYSKCGHAYAMPEENMPCDNPHCKFSPAHPSTCTGASCKQTCWQYRQPTQQYSPQVSGSCPRCGGGPAPTH